MDQPTDGPRLRQHLLLFYREGSSTDRSDEARYRRKQEYEGWARALEPRGDLVFMGELSPDQAAAWLAGATADELGPAERPVMPVELVGVCIIRARDRASAIEAARRSPHVADGGLVAIHEIESP